MTSGESGPMHARSPPSRSVDALVLGVGVAAGAAARTVSSLSVRALLAVGGACAEGGAFAVDRPGTSGSGNAFLLAAGLALLCLVATLWGVLRLTAPNPLLLALPWILVGAWNFFEAAFFPPAGRGISVGYLVAGSIFVLLGVAPLLQYWADVRKERRAGAAGGAATPAPWWWVYAVVAAGAGVFGGQEAWRWIIPG